MKKLLSLLVVLVMVLAIAPAVFAEEEPALGTEANPNMLFDQASTVTNVGTTYYQGHFSGMIMTVTGNPGFSVIYNGQPTQDANGVVTMSVASPNPRMPVVFAIVGDGEFSVNFEYPVGTIMNPEAIWDLSEIKASVAEGNDQGYYYSWYNFAVTGTVSFAVSSATEGVEYDVILTSTGSYEMHMLSESEDGTVTMDVAPNDTITIQVVAVPDEQWNIPAVDVTLVGEIIYPVGSSENPAELVIGKNTASIEAGNFQGYFFNWTADVTGLLSITMPDGDWMYAVNNLTTGIYGDTQWSDSDPVIKTWTIPVNAGDDIRITVNTYNPEDMWSNPAGDITLTASFRVGHGTPSAPYEIYSAGELNSIDVAAGSATYLAVNGQLNGMILNIVEKDGIFVMVNDVEVEAIDGLFSVELTGTPTNKVVVANVGENAVELTASIEYPLGSESNPIVITTANQLSSVAIDAGSKTYYNISSMLSGMVLNVVEKEGITVTVNGAAVKAENGLFTAVLNGAPSNSVVVANAGDKAVETVATIEYPLGTESNPITITTANQLSSVAIDAGSKTYYNISSMLSGMILNIAEKEGVTVTVNGVAVKAENGLFTAVLNGAPSNQVVVANAGDKAVELVASIEYALGTEGNPIVVNTAAQLSKVELAAGSETYLAINGQLNGNVLTITGDSSTTVTANGVEVTGKNGVFTVELDKAPMNQIVIGNSGAKAAEYKAVIVAKSALNPSTGDSTILVLPLVLMIAGVMGVALVASNKKRTVA